MDRLTKEYKFKNFVEAMNFVNEVARIAEARDHHPDILVKYNQVALTYWTHTENSVTDKDMRLAADVDELFKTRSVKI
jgi:4a-hydroxytetrahydrobiopterin dehydratase